MVMVQEYLRRRGAPFEVVDHPSAFTSIAEAFAVGISADEVLKCVVLDTRGGHALGVVPASTRLDMDLVQEALRDPAACLAAERELEADLDVELGAMPPTGWLFGLPTFVDPAVFEHETILFAAGSRTLSIRMRTEDLFRDEPYTVAPLTARRESEDRRKELIP